jgi:hypothetical protein
MGWKRVKFAFIYNCSYEKVVGRLVISFYMIGFSLSPSSER